jgi:hypothetical protein
MVFGYGIKRKLWAREREVGGDDGKGGLGARGSRECVRWGERRARGVERKLAEQQQLSWFWELCLFGVAARSHLQYGGWSCHYAKNKIRIDDAVACSENRGMILEKYGTPKLERRGEGGPENNKEVYHVLVGLVARCLRDKNRVGTSILPPLSPPTGCAYMTA